MSADKKYSGTPTKPYIFFRKDGFYPITLFDDADARHNAEINPGTIRVEDTNGRVVWRQQ